MTACYPLLFEPILKEKVWGGRRLARYGKKLPQGTLIGESWELADLPTTSVSGGGGAAAHSPIRNGQLEESTLHDAISIWGDDLLGRARLTPEGGFPLLVKYLDAREHLSVQVHPSPAYAATHRGARLKTECWFVLEAEPGGKIYKGIEPGVTPDRFAEHIERGTVADDLVAVDAVPGDCHLLPSGTCHALGAGVLVAEVQTPSDTTFRVYDWSAEYGRSGRDLHIAEALECIDFGPAPDATRLGEGKRHGRLAATEHFPTDEARLRPGDEMPCGGGGGGGRLCVAVMMLAGAGRIVTAGSVHPAHIRTGDTALVPAAIAENTAVHAEKRSVVLRVSV